MNILNSFQSVTDISLATAQPLDLSTLVVGAQFNMGLALLQLMLFLVSLFLILLVLIQRGKGGGLTGALGGGGGESAFGSKSGDAFTKITVGTALFWITLCMVTIAAYNPPETAYGNRAAERQAEADAASDLLPPAIGADPDATEGGVGAAAAEGGVGAADAGTTGDGATTDSATQGATEGDAETSTEGGAAAPDDASNEDSQ